ncbi:MAG TPA: pseudouridine synthase [Verrucomicrobiae bacterium]|jgi:23S rRNA (cytosine1962-C5)-methyltransferase|nr:pseudouridine synthase [Verrucomicrobiae bacterium]
MESIVHEDEHLLVVNKPAGWNTHSPGPFANEGLYEWLKNREPRWSRLAIIHRLDKETSGVMLFGKAPEANRSLSHQFEDRRVRKKYLFLTDRPSARSSFDAVSDLIRVNERYKSGPGGQRAETHFRLLSTEGGRFLWEAEPRTGRTHQIRVHASEHGIPIVGDVMYGGSPAARIHLHAAELALRHPVTGQPVVFRSAPNFAEPMFRQLRAAPIDPALTNAYRLVHGAADGWPGLYVDKWHDYLLAESERPLASSSLAFLRGLPAKGIYHKLRSRQPVKQPAQLIAGEPAPENFLARENGLQFQARFAESGSAGLFLDQRDNRRRLLTGYVAGGFELREPRAVLNTFAYTCAFSVAAAARGAKVTSVDLSRRYLEWGRENFAANQMAPDQHEFLTGDAFRWLARLTRQQRQFDIVILDPPTFSRSKENGVFSVEKDYGRLLAAALPLVQPGGVLLASTNAATYPPKEFLLSVEQSLTQCRRRAARQHYIPQPPDFPIHHLEPAYLKTVWVELAN